MARAGLRDLGDKDLAAKGMTDMVSFTPAHRQYRPRSNECLNVVSEVQ